MTTNSTPDGGKRPLTQLVLSAYLVLFFVISPVGAVRAEGTTEDPSRSIKTLPRIVATTEVTELSEESDKRSEIGEPAVLEVVAPARLEALKTYKIDVTSYNSEAGQTDDSPFTTADGSTVRDGIIAANFLPFNTKVRFPELFGDRVFEVHDRMNPRYNLRADIWMSHKKDSLKLGLKRNVKIEVIEWGDNSDTQWKRIAQENTLKRNALREAAIAKKTTR